MSLCQCGLVRYRTRKFKQPTLTSSVAVMEAGSSKSAHWFLPWLVDSVFSLYLHLLFHLCVCVFLASLCRGTSPVGLGPTLSILYLFKDFLSKQSHSKVQRLGLQCVNLAENTVKPVTVAWDGAQVVSVHELLVMLMLALGSHLEKSWCRCNWI